MMVVQGRGAIPGLFVFFWRDFSKGDYPPSMTRQEEKLMKQAMIRKVLDQLGEHFDCVQIVALDSCGKVESHYTEGSGSWYARMQALREVLWMDEARTKHGAIEDTLDADPPDDSESWQFL